MRRSIGGAPGPNGGGPNMNACCRSRSSRSIAEAPKNCALAHTGPARDSIHRHRVDTSLGNEEGCGVEQKYAVTCCVTALDRRGADLGEGDCAHGIRLQGRGMKLAMSQTNVLVLVGSLRAGSVNRQLAETAVSAAPEGATLTVFEGLADVPFYNEDIDVEGASIPAYNGTIPAVLKNAIDWISRPYGVGAVKDKAVAVISASPSGNGAKWAHEDTTKAVRIAGGKVVEDTALSIGGTGALFGELHPRENAEVLAQVSKVVSDLVDAGKQLVNA
eukprot:gene23526-28193_t